LAQKTEIQKGLHPKHTILLFWSGTTSEKVAEVLMEWLPKILPGSNPWISHAIPKGTVWFEQLRKQISKGRSAILCVTPTNLASPWLHFEAGAAWKAANEDVYVTPLLFQVEKDKLKLPLSSFQRVEISNYQDMQMLLRQINERCAMKQSEQNLTGNFLKIELDELKAKLEKIAVDDFPPFYPFEDAEQATKWVRCHGTKYNVPDTELFWNSLLTAAKQSFRLVGNSNKSWISKTESQSRLLGDAITRICKKGGEVHIVSGTDEERAIQPTKNFLQSYVFCDLADESAKDKQIRLNALVRGLTYSVVKYVNYRAVISDDTALIIPLLNTDKFRTESMVIELTKQLQPGQLNNYKGDIDRLIKDSENYFPKKWTKELTDGQLNYLDSPGDFIKGLASIGIVPRDFVFYITSACNLRCKHCYIGDDLLNAAQHWPKDNICALLRVLDLDRLTLVGGEPLQYYGINEVLDTVRVSRIKERRVTTNLTELSDENIVHLKNADFRVSVSLDGSTAELHDAIRGAGKFEKTVFNIRRLIAEGVDVEITHTVTNKTADKLKELIFLLRSLKVRRLNLHKVSAQGNALKNHDLVMSATQWRSFLDVLQKVARERGRQENPIIVRYPLLFVNSLEYEELKRDDYHHHVLRSYYSVRGNRVVLYCNGEVFISSEAFGTDALIGRIFEGNFVENSNARSEIKLAKQKDFRISDINSEIQGDEMFQIPLSFSYRKEIYI
jgi:MoaA/NifB/PqqE/SkfB family radical SAM enzyme